MQIDPTSGFPAVGRRRVTTLTKEEWREALEQQRREKEAQQRKPRHESDNQGNDTTDTNATPHLLVENADAAMNNRSGRRFVAAMSAEEWKASLAQQIREKELQREQQKRGHTAPDSVSPTCEPTAIPEAPRSQSASVMPSCLPGLAEDAATLAGRRRRGGAPQQSREEYLRSLQEQIELKKKRDEAEGATLTGRGKLGKRRVIEDDDDSGGFWPPLPVTTPASKQPLTATTANVEVSQPAAAVERQPSAEAEGYLASAEAKPAIEEPTTASPVVAPSTEATPAVVMDPAALSKLFELCEGMKQQNEELKQQLRDQQSVLASLAVATTTTSTSNTAGAKSVSKSGKTHAKKSSKPDVEAKNREKRPSKQRTTNLTAAKTVATKAEPKQPARLKRNTLAAAPEPVSCATPPKPTAATTSNNDEDTSNVAPLMNNPPKPTQAKPSRLPQPRVVPRLWSAQAFAMKTNSTMEQHPTEPPEEHTAGDATIGGLTPPSEVTPLPVPTETSPSPHVSDDEPEIEYPSTSVELVPLEPIFELEQHPHTLPRLVPSPPIRRQSISTKKPPPPERASLPLLVTRSSVSLVSVDGCLDHTASSTSTRVRSSFARPHALDAGDLESQCSSVAMLDGSSAMVPCGSTLSPF